MNSPSLGRRPPSCSPNILTNLPSLNVLNQHNKLSPASSPRTESAKLSPASSPRAGSPRAGSPRVSVPAIAGLSKSRERTASKSAQALMIQGQALYGPVPGGASGPGGPSGSGRGISKSKPYGGGAAGPQTPGGGVALQRGGSSAGSPRGGAMGGAMGGAAVSPPGIGGGKAGSGAKGAGKAGPSPRPMAKAPPSVRSSLLRGSSAA